MDPVTQLYKYLDQQNIDEVETFRRPTPRFRLSELDNCPRRIYYRHEGVRPMALPGFVSLFGMDGDIAHDQVRWLLRKAGVKLGGLEFNEDTGEIVELLQFRKAWQHRGEDFTIAGRADGEIEVGGENMLLEIKSVDGFKYQGISRAYNKGEILEYLETGNNGKFRKFLIQSEVGMRMLDYQHTYLLLKDRSLCTIGLRDEKHNIHEGGIILSRNDKLWEEALNTMAYVSKCRRIGDAPMRHIEGHYECGQCEFRDTCGRK